MVDGPNPIVVGYASCMLAALGGARLGAAPRRWLGHDGRSARVGADLARVALVAGVTQGTGWLLDPDLFGAGVLRPFVWFVLVPGVTVVALREAGRLLVRGLRRFGGGQGDTAAPAHD
ncbi:hypothetical protein N0B31_03335 [Salinirubellus salinus]|uniref:Uncharacterized protein n=1 Tax=Salinirubellus salinus TaxID=1364945 RepID=A0A9E7UC31_9EURY|nr:hypothetical protein [Salinirubellus salinus]UWM55324.1 hypothetical protein N0B31_03335 [Salinirubellus salinus]